MFSTTISAPKKNADEAMNAQAVEAYESVITGTDFDDISIEEAELRDAVEAYDELINTTEFN